LPQPLATILRRAALAAALALPVAPVAAQGLAGPYLAAMQADFRNDYTAAAEYFARAMRVDPDNLALMQNATVARVAAGELAEAVDLADRLAKAMPENQVAAVVRLAEALRAGDFDAAAGHAEAAGESLNPLLGGLLGGWIEVGREDFDAAIARFDAMTENDAIAAYGQYHKALALALAGDFVQAAEILSGGADGEPLELGADALLARAEILAQLGREEEAVALLEEQLATGFPDATLIRLRDRLAAGEEVPFDRVASAADGAAEAFLTLAAALNNENSDRFALIYARLAGYINDELAEADLLAAEVLERHGQYQLATAALAEVPQESPWFVTAEIRRANTLRSAGDPEAGIEVLRKLAEGRPDNIEVHSALADALRAEERFAEAAEAYSGAIDLIGVPQPVHWVLYYSRGIAYERSDQWEKAEADFRKALELEPEQPLVLNYLGYSLVEQRRDLEEALDMIERAVAGQPDDGYITDSLGWVLYRLGRYEEALPHMLRAVELTPTDPIINDHLGDVLWMVGRQREARFQWQRALSFEPETEADAERIRRKLEVGLDQVLAEEGGAGGTDG
jgi:tetratricopeptide (TPR) repeat protein